MDGLRPDRFLRRVRLLNGRGKRLVRRLFLSLALVQVLGCQVALEAELLELHSYSPTALDLGSQLRIEGDGFLPQDLCEIELVGTTHRPAEPPRQVSATFSVRPQSGETLVLPIGEGAIRALAGRGTFRGQLRLTFAAHGGLGAVSGVLEEVVLDIGPATRDKTMTQQIHQVRRGAGDLASLGIVVQDTPESGQGLLVAEVRRASAASYAGIRPEDRIVEARGIHVRSVDDLAVPAEEERLTFSVLSPGTVTARDVVLVRNSERSERSLTPLSLVLAATLLVLLLLAPTAQRTTGWAHAWVSGFLPRLLDLAGFQERGGGSTVRARMWDVARRSPRVVVVFAAFLVAFGVFPYFSRLSSDGLDARALFLVALALDLLRRGFVTGFRQRGAFAWFFDSVGSTAALAAIALLSGTMTITGVVAAQGQLPWEWYALGNPIGFVAAVCLLGLLSTVRVSKMECSGQEHSVWEQVRLMVWSGLFASFFLGGWLFPGGDARGLDGAPVHRLTAALVFCGKSFLVYYSVYRLRSVAVARDALWFSVLAVLAALAAAGLAVFGAGAEGLGGTGILFFAALMIGIGCLWAHAVRRLVSDRVSPPWWRRPVPKAPKDRGASDERSLPTAGVGPHAARLGAP